jgi:hypothetical protein
MGVGAGTGTPTSPWVYEAHDYLDRAIRITVPFNVATGALSNATVFRDVGCLYTHIYLGLGTDGTVNATAKVFTVPDGTTTVTTAQMAARGISTYADLNSVQVTAGP